LTQRNRVLGAVIGLLLLGVLLSACGAAPVAQNWPGLTAANGTIYVISGMPQQVYLLDAETGVQQATFTPQGEKQGVVYWSPVTVGGGLAFVGFAESQSRIAGLYAFDPTTGQEMWNVPAEDLIIPAPTYAEGVVYFGSSDGKVYAVDVETKSVKPGWPVETEEAIWASPFVVEGRVYVAAMDHYLYCLDAETGQILWKHEVGGAMAAQPTFEDGTLYVGSYDGKVYAIDANSGQRVEGFDFQAGNWIWSTPLLVDGQLYVTSLDGQLYALDPANGDSLPSYPYDSGEIDGTQDLLQSSPVQAGSYIVVASESGRVIAVQEARRQWYWPSGMPQAAIYTTPVVVGDTVYVVLVNGQVQALDAQTGVAGWTFTPPESN
jgi:outer membrane protein assembly factor BamB